MKKNKKCYIYTRVLTAIQVDDMLAHLITVMTNVERGLFSFLVLVKLLLNIDRYGDKI